MKAYFTLLLVLTILLCGCTGTDTTTQTGNSSSTIGMRLTIKAFDPIDSKTSIEINKTISIAQVGYNPNQKYVLENGYFMIPLEVNNGNDLDYDKILIKLDSQSSVLKTSWPYSYSGTPLIQTQEDYYVLDTKILARQKNQILIFGQVGNLPGNLSAGELILNMRLYDTNVNNPINGTQITQKIRICRLPNC